MKKSVLVLLFYLYPVLFCGVLAGDTPPAADEIRLLNQKARKQMNEANYRGALDTAKKLASVVEKTYGKDSAESGLTLHLLAKIYKSLSRPEDALRSYQRAIEIFEPLPASDLPLFRLWKELAWFHRSRNESSASRIAFEKAISYGEKVTRLMNPEGVELLFDYACALELNAMRDEAEKIWSRGLAIQREINGGRLDIISLPAGCLFVRQRKKPGFVPPPFSIPIKVEITVNEFGKVTQANPVGGQSDLWSFARGLLLKTEFAPLMLDGKPLPMRGQIWVGSKGTVFRLSVSDLTGN
jgi:tetratricopeptide (TPR) repeat protein